MKGVSPLIGMVLVIAFGFIAMGIVLAVVNPLLDRAKDSGVINEATENMQSLDAAIKTVATEALGSKRIVPIKITEGALRSDSANEWLYFDFEPRRTELDGTSGDVQIITKPHFLEFFNRYAEDGSANGTWTAVNGTWSIDSGKFKGTGGLSYHNIGNLNDFGYSAGIAGSNAPDGQVYVVPGDPRDIVLFLPFDGNVNTTVTTAYDYSAYKNNGTLTNSPSWVKGQFGNATKINGDTDYVNVPDSASLDITDQMTSEVWVNIP